MTPKIVYLLCAATSAFCFLLLFRAYRRSRMRLLLWSSASFFVYAVANALLVIDMLVLPGVDIGLYRSLTTLLAVSLLLVGLVLCS